MVRAHSIPAETAPYLGEETKMLFQIYYGTEYIRLKLPLLFIEAKYTVYESTKMTEMLGRREI